MVKFILLFLLIASTCYAQQKPVVSWADNASYVTAAVEPSVSVIQALKSNHKLCELGKLGLKEAIGNGTALTIKHFVNSPRPCIGCSPDGMPSEHTANAFIGSNWQLAVVFGTGTGILRHTANRHTWIQVGAGVLTGVGADLLGNLIKCYD